MFTLNEVFFINNSKQQSHIIHISIPKINKIRINELHLTLLKIMSLLRLKKIKDGTFFSSLNCKILVNLII